MYILGAKKCWLYMRSHWISNFLVWYWEALAVRGVRKNSEGYFQMGVGKNSFDGGE